MNARERVLKTVARKEPDKLPIDFGGTDCSGMHLSLYERLRKELGIEPGPMKNGGLVQLVAEIEEEVQDRFCASTHALHFHPARWKPWRAPFGTEFLVPERFNPVRLENGDFGVMGKDGVIRSRLAHDSFYFDPVSFPLEGISSPGELDAFDDLFERWDFSTVYDEPLEDYGRRAEKLHQGDKAIVAQYRMHLIQAGQIMRGYEQFMVDLMLDEPLVTAMMEKLLDAYKRRTTEHMSVTRDFVDVVFLTDDLGTQTGPLIGPDTYRARIKPYIAELVRHIKKESGGKPIVMHSCGAVRDFIPDLIEIGIDALNPVQIAATGMRPEELKKDFGRDICFWGGGCDTQRILNSGTVQQVRDEVKRNIDIFAPGGGFVFTQVHNIQPEVPVENVIAMFETAMRCGGY